ncbi:hypothetical protein O6H91_14G068700 [Diphasiastrum complanatum]|uniref:Uncharacterized protein n=1 Tax=Diphasiastrum complanatum TaxID=34168 RepID=A0ACC2BQR7_DIPCM|nr:hypothetical protein O6H91_14G068700 [Diphasiastrum complanatum]
MATNKRKFSASSSSPSSSSGGGGADDDCLVWPPTIIVENTRVRKSDDGRWTGIGNPEMACLLKDIGHTQGKPKAVWGKEGHMGQVLVEYPLTQVGLHEGERLHNFFKSCERGREQWLKVRPLWHGLPGHEAIEEGPDFVRYDEVEKIDKRVLYGYLATEQDLSKLPKKKNRRPKTVSRKVIEKAFISASPGELVVDPS